MSIKTDEYFPTGFAYEADAAGTRIDHFSMFGGHIAVNHNVELSNGYSPAHETSVVLGACGLEGSHIATATDSNAYLVLERQRQVALGLGLPPNASMATITAHMLKRDVLVVETPAKPSLVFDERDHKLLEGLDQGLKVSELQEILPLTASKTAARSRLAYLEQKLRTSSLAGVMLYGYTTGQLPKSRPAYFSSNNQPGHELLSKGTTLPPDTDISLEGATLEDAQLRGLYFKGNLISINDKIAPLQGERFTSREMTVLGLTAIGLTPTAIAKAMNNKDVSTITSAQERLARRLGVTARIMGPQIIDRAISSGLLTFEQPAADGSLSTGLAEYIRRVLPGELHNKALGLTNDALLPLILRKHALTPAAAITYGHIYGLLPANPNQLHGGGLSRERMGIRRHPVNSQFIFTDF